jgi:hypothetical protein
MSVGAQGWVDAIKHLTFVFEPCKVPLALSPK